MTVLVLLDAPSGGDLERGKLLSGEAGEYLTEQLKTVEGVKFKVASVLNAPPGKKKLGKNEGEEWSRLMRKRISEAKAKVVLLVGSFSFQALTGGSGIKKASGRPIEKDGVVYIPCVNPSAMYHDPSVQWMVVQACARVRECVEYGGIPQSDELNVRLVEDEGSIKDFLWALTGELSLDIETSCLYPWQKFNAKGEVDPAKIKAIGFGSVDTQWIILTPDHPQSKLSHEAFGSLLEDIDHSLKRNQVSLIAHNGKFDFLWLWVHYGMEWLEFFDFDTMLAHYLLDENSRHGLKEVAMVECGAPDWDVDRETKQGKGQSLEKFIRYLGHDLLYTFKLKSVLLKKLKREPRVKGVFDHIMMPCARLFTEAEYDGVFIDITKFDEAENVLRGMLKEAEKKLKRWGDINWGSPKQLAELLFTKLKLKAPIKTKTGAPSTSESALNQIDHPCVGDLIKFREAKQQLSFFIEGWKPFLHKRRIKGQDLFFLHPSFKLHGTVTGRLSCEHPNLQQVPRDPRIRTLISAEPGWTLVECDLSQIELRIAAELANERHMLEAFRTGVDIHWLTVIREVERGGGLRDLVVNTASTWVQRKVKYAEAIDLLLKMGPDAAAEINPEWKEYRKKAKAINFGYLYGMWWKKFKTYARDNYGIEVTDDQAQESRIAYFELYSDLPNWHSRQKRLVRRDGYIETLSGRRRRLPDAMSPHDSPSRGAAERQAINSPVQSFANELNLMAALQLRREFGRDVVRICATVHDAILVRVRDDYVEQVYNRLLAIMKRPSLMDTLDIELKVPVEAEGKIGPWGAGLSLKKWKEKRHVSV